MFGLIYRFYQLPGGFKFKFYIWTYFWASFWANFGLRRPNNCLFFFKIVDFLLLFVRIVIRCFDWFNHFYRLSGIFKNQILYLDLFLGQIWAKLWIQKAQKRPKTTLPNHWFSIAFVSIVIWSFKIYNWFINYFHLVFWGIQNSKYIFHIWTYFWAKSGPNLDSKDKNQPTFLFQNCGISTAFVGIVIRSFKMMCGLFHYFYPLPRVFEIQILYLYLFLGQIWAK